MEVDGSDGWPMAASKVSLSADGFTSRKMVTTMATMEIRKMKNFSLLSRRRRFTGSPWGVKI